MSGEDPSDDTATDPIEPAIDAVPWAWSGPVGAVVADRDTGDRLIVIERHNVSANERFIASIDKTVAEANPAYPQDDDVVTAVYLEDISATHDGRRVDTLALDIQHTRPDTLRYYEFPTGRLEPIPPERVRLSDFRETGGDRA